MKSTTFLSGWERFRATVTSDSRFQHIITDKYFLDLAGVRLPDLPFLPVIFTPTFY